MRYALYFLTAVALATSSTSHPQAQTAAGAGAPPQAARARVGVFDSRCVALAYYNSPEFQKEMQQMRSDLDAARAAGNQAKVADLEFQGPAIQNLLHYQVFSTASIPNVLEKVRGSLPKMATDAGASMLVSRWDVGFKGTDVDYVDVTDQLVQLFNPTARVLDMVAATKAQRPMPLLEAVKTIRPGR